MRIQRFWWLGAIATMPILLIAVLAAPAWAASARQSDDAVPDAYVAMHEACATGDVQGMAEGMDALTDEDWEAMQEHTGGHMGDGHHGGMGPGMMGMGGMMGGWSGQGMMNW